MFLFLPCKKKRMLEGVHFFLPSQSLPALKCSPITKMASTASQGSSTAQWTATLHPRSCGNTLKVRHSHKATYSSTLLHRETAYVSDSAKTLSVWRYSHLLLYTCIMERVPEPSWPVNTTDNHVIWTARHFNEHHWEAEIRFFFSFLE